LDELKSSRGTGIEASQKEIWKSEATEVSQGPGAREGSSQWAVNQSYSSRKDIEWGGTVEGKTPG
jgi:hypothetical protein